MSLNLDKSGWKCVLLGDVISRSREQVDPVAAGIDRYVAGGHIESHSITIDRWGDPNDGQMGSTFRYTFKPGQTLFVSARPYLRKSGVVDFSGVVADKTYVLDGLPEGALLQEFLPFVLSSDRFVEYANAEATGSMNPRLLWGPMQRYQFDLPPLDEQKRIANLLWALENSARAQTGRRGALVDVRQAWLDAHVAAFLRSETVAFSETWARSPESGYSSAPVAEVTGRYVLSLAALGPEGYRSGNLKNVADSHQIRTAVLRQGDLLVSRANTVDAVGRVGIYSEDRDDVSFPDTMMRLTLKQQFVSEFAAAVIGSSHGRTHMRRNAAGSATSMVKINRTSLGRFPFPVVSTVEQREFLARLSRLNRSVESVDAEVCDLAAVRAALLGDIFGGN
jgi:type I restriction enzyme S subunit